MGEDKEKKTKTKSMKIGIEIKEDQELETDKKENGRKVQNIKALCDSLLQYRSNSIC